MPRSRDLLDRFRPAGTPGAAARTGVPADRAAELSTELEPVLARLADSEEAARRIRTEAEAEAERRRREAAGRARALVDTARRQAEAERADAAARVAEQAEAETAATVAAGDEAAAQVRRRALDLMPGYVARAVAALRADLEGRPS